jgi:hypothetical protein
MKNYSHLINKTFKHPITGKYFKIKDIQSDGKTILSEISDSTHIDVILNNWEQVNESINNETLICG